MPKRDRLALLVMEGADGKVEIELFKDPDSSRLAFESMAGKPHDPPTRATFIELDWRDGFTSRADTVNLPKIRHPDDEPFGHRIGVGPIPDPEKDEADTGKLEC